MYGMDTKVPVERSQAELEKLLKQRGGAKFFRGEDEGREVIACDVSGRKLMFELPLPTEKEARSEDKRLRLRRAKWRCLVLAVKAKFASVDAGVESFDDAFLAQIVVPTGDGRATRVGKIAQEQIAEAYKKGTAFNFGAFGLLPDGGEK